MSLGGTFEEENKWLLEENEKRRREMIDFDELNKQFTPEEIHDENIFKPLKGAYVCRIDRLEHIQGVSEKTGDPYDFYSLNAEIVEIAEGDKGVGRYLKQTYRNDNEGIKKLLNAMFTSGIELDRSSQESLDLSLPSAKDKTIKIRAWRWTPERTREGIDIPEEDRRSIQQIKVVKEIKLGKGGKDKGEDLKPSSVPF